MSNDPLSPFDTLETAFRLLTSGPSPLSVDGRAVCGLPQRPVPLDELGGRLLHPSISYHTRDVALAVLLRRARQDGGAWTVGLAGVLLPGLRRAAAPLAKAMPGKAADLEAEMLAALVETIAVLPAGADRIAAHMLWPAVRAAHRFVERERAGRAWEEPHASLPTPARLPAHPDLVLEQAVREGVISARHAELVAETRIGGVALRELARRWDVSYKALCRRRERCEPALIAWLVTRQMSPNRP